MQRALVMLQAAKQAGMGHRRPLCNYGSVSGMAKCQCDLQERCQAFDLLSAAFNWHARPHVLEVGCWTGHVRGVAYVQRTVGSRLLPAHGRPLELLTFGGLVLPWVLDSSHAALAITLLLEHKVQVHGRRGPPLLLQLLRHTNVDERLLGEVARASALAGILHAGNLDKLLSTSAHLLCPQAADVLRRVRTGLVPANFHSEHILSSGFVLLLGHLGSSQAQLTVMAETFMSQGLPSQYPHQSLQEDPHEQHAVGHADARAPERAVQALIDAGVSMSHVDPLYGDTLPMMVLRLNRWCHDRDTGQPKPGFDPLPVFQMLWSTATPEICTHVNEQGYDALGLAAALDLYSVCAYLLEQTHQADTRSMQMPVSLPPLTRRVAVLLLRYGYLLHSIAECSGLREAGGCAVYSRRCAACKLWLPPRAFGRRRSGGLCKRCAPLRLTYHNANYIQKVAIVPSLLRSQPQSLRELAALAIAQSMCATCIAQLHRPSRMELDGSSYKYVTEALPQSIGDSWSARQMTLLHQAIARSKKNRATFLADFPTR